MYKTIAILGRQPALGIAELESLFGADAVEPYGTNACFLKMKPHDVDFTRIGGSIRLCEIIEESPVNWRNIENKLLDIVPAYANEIEGKFSFGISSFGLSITKKTIARSALTIKKTIKQSGSSVRMVPHNDLILGSATVLYNKLTAENGLEICVISDGETAFIAKTIHVQNIDAYAARDQARPMRDAKVGMLPPKLAQIIINLAVNKHSVERILDPFCGTGVILQEATLMDYEVYGTDLEPRMVQYSIDNLLWLDEKYTHASNFRRIEVGDATTHQWHEPEKISVVAGETYLGQPLSALPSNEHLSKIMYEVNLLHHKFLVNIGKQIKPGTRLCLAVPTWRGKHEFLRLPALDHITEMGYTRMSFKHAKDSDLIYHRVNQVVGRELLVLEKR